MMNTATQGAVAIKREEQSPVVVGADAYLEMIERAARDPNVDIDKMERLMLMHERVVERQARAAYASALASMQCELPSIAERGKIDIGRGKPQSYALWEDINEAIKPVLSKHGFALSFRTGRTDAAIIVTGILSHREGHSEETTMQLPIDTSGSKNAVQAVGSSTSYGKRYTAAALLNITSHGEDDDGKAGGIQGLTEEQVGTLIEMLESVGASKDEFCAWAKVERLSQIPARDFQKMVAAIKSYQR
jgi:hypothetical protein